ncbi:MAG TPA: PfkB family carbohydrate kinase [Nitrososphaerales archaeon]|nr:PfkB family carbohydrate kinase [Nitrososphaerales archaeon]HUK75357.1 PfkB family carbohydrate kinase [Nitrososphaerales archaeon]
MSRRAAADRTTGGQLLTVVGAINWDVSIFVDRFPGVGEEVPALSVEEYHGGKGANVAVAAARLLGKGRVALVGALGDDDVAEEQLADLRREGVLTSGLVKAPRTSSGRAFVIVENGGRKTIHTLFGANDEIAPEHIEKAAVAKVIDSSSIVVVMDAPTSVGLAAARRAKGRGARIVYSPCVRAKESEAGVGDLLNLADYLVVDRTELRSLMPGAPEPRALAQLASAHRHLTVVETRGSEGCRLALGGRILNVPAVDLAVLGKRPVNSTGCGDAFLGAFCSFILEGAETEEAANAANLAGALKAARRETRGSPGRSELDAASEALKESRRRP